MYGAVRDDLQARLAGLEGDGLLKRELVMTTPQGAHVEVAERGELLNLCANNYLGLANHPEMVAAAHEALDRWGYGMASVRFILFAPNDWPARAESGRAPAPARSRR